MKFTEYLAIQIWAWTVRACTLPRAGVGAAAAAWSPHLQIFPLRHLKGIFLWRVLKAFSGSEINIIEKHKWTNIIFPSRSTEDAQWSDPRTPLKTQKDNWSSLVIDSGYAGELPSDGGDGSIPYSKWVELFTCPWRSVKLLIVGIYSTFAQCARI